MDVAERRALIERYIYIEAGGASACGCREFRWGVFVGHSINGLIAGSTIAMGLDSER